MRLLLNVANLLPLLLLAACAGSPQKTAEPDTPPEPLRLPFSEPEAPIAELDSDVVFSALAGEIATQRGQLDLAYRYQLQTAILAGDAHAAERATRIAMLAKQREQALKAANLWIDLAPNDLAGRQRAASLLLQARQPVPALEPLRAVVAISQAKGDDGFLTAMAAVSKEQDHELALQVMRSLESSHHDDPRAGYALAMLGLIWKDYSLAETEIQKVVQRHPGWGKGYVLLSRLHAARGDKAGARRVLEQAVDPKAGLQGLAAALDGCQEEALGPTGYAVPAEGSGLPAGDKGCQRRAQVQVDDMQRHAAGERDRSVKYGAFP